MLISSASFKMVALSEVSILQQLKHPKIIEYYGCAEEDDSVLIFMEYLVGGSVRQMMEQCQQPIIEKTAIKYIAQVLEALDYIHSKDNGIVHCDLKCDNLLLDGKGGIKLGDFGVAVKKIINTINQSRFTHGPTKGGSLYWMAPELLNDEDTYGRPVDIWSLGCTIVEMLTGEPPYRKLKTLKFMAELGGKNLSYHPNELVPEETSTEMKKFLSMLLKYDPDSRLKTGSAALRVFREKFNP
uniref:Protein kinase domain-containing protein n=1 Tax=Plectus sambesii TaxID=2011161 RepID=A0A914XLI6_9BILA